MFSLGAAHPARSALGHIDGVLKAQPRKDDEALSEATRDLAVYREAMLGERRAGRHVDDEALSNLNAIIAVVMAMHFPVGQPPWAELEKAREWLRQLLKSA